jgi:hypothetical protein
LPTRWREDEPRNGAVWSGVRDKTAWSEHKASWEESIWCQNGYF